MNCRFWEHINGDHVKLTLRPGQTLDWGRYESTEEGWSLQGETWSLSADSLAITRESVSDGTDCDGRISSGHTAIASADQFTFTDCYQFAGKRPDWQPDEDWQRDYSAEAMNY